MTSFPFVPNEGLDGQSSKESENASQGIPSQGVELTARFCLEDDAIFLEDGVSLHQLLADFPDMAIDQGDEEADDAWQHFMAEVAENLDDSAPGARHFMYPLVAHQGDQGLDRSSALESGSVEHQADAQMYPWIGGVPIPRQDFDQPVVPIPTDVCFGLIDYPGTNAWRDTLQTLSNQPWSTEVYFAMRRELAGRRFLIRRNTIWYLATEDEIYVKSNQRFRDAKKPRSPRGRGRPPGSAPRSAGGDGVEGLL